jgi:lipopolysaccharide export system protein LptC
LLDRLSLYAPVVLMAVLALLTWWLLRLTPTFEPEAPEPPPQHVVDYHMKNFAVRSFTPDGQLKGEFLGAVARHYPDTDALEVTRLRINGQGAGAQTLSASADQALVNGDASEMQLMGHAQVISSAASAGLPASSASAAQGNHPTVQLDSAFLHVWVNDARVSTDRPVRITQGASQVDADSLSFDKNTQFTQLSGRVRAVLMPAAKSKAASSNNKP